MPDEKVDEEKDCGSCHGTKECPDCNEGKVDCPTCGSSDYECETCNGSGRCQDCS